MGDAPSPPSGDDGGDEEEHREEADAGEPADAGADSDDEGPELYPFFDAAAGGGPGCNVRAGWAEAETGDAVELVVNYNGSAGSPAALSAYEAALEWYRDTVRAVAAESDE
jgi:hypothetical protein